MLLTATLELTFYDHFMRGMHNFRNKICTALIPQLYEFCYMHRVKMTA